MVQPREATKRRGGEPRDLSILGYVSTLETCLITHACSCV
jgi:hypothetical protein